MRQVRVRMYRPGGIGDCFLLSFPTGKGMAHMLIDCGVLKGTEDAGNRMQAVMADIVKTTGGLLQVLVVTHEHWDHVSGLLQAETAFKQLSIGEVWLAWTERPGDNLAKQLREQRAQAHRAVEAARQKLRLSAAPAASAALRALDSLNLFSEGFAAAGGKTTAAAMAWARQGTGAQVRWLSPGDAPLAIAGVDGVRAFILGPPRDPRQLRQSDPSKRAPEVYQLAGGMDLGLMAALSQVGGMDTGRPFDPSFEKPVEKAQEDSFFRKFYYSAEDWRQIELDWLGAAERLALQLDSDTNNTSLVVAIELLDSGRVLLFPGDAQVGNWLSWESLEWTVEDRDGKRFKIDAKDLLARTVLYKVGHHASHNATLREKGLELMQSTELAAMIPVYEGQAQAQGKNGWEMPFGPLLERLRQKTLGRVMRADVGLPDARREAMPENVAQEFGKRIALTEDYIDYMISL